MVQKRFFSMGCVLAALCAASGSPTFAQVEPTIAPTPRPAATSSNTHKGGTLRLAAQNSGGTLDPQVSYISLIKQLETSVYDGLLAFPKFAGSTAQPVIANLAEAV
ncbi:MAG: hypothetical protein ABF513_06905, partial [Acetobacter malorum]